MLIWKDEPNNEATKNCAIFGRHTGAKYETSCTDSDANINIDDPPSQLGNFCVSASIGTTPHERALCFSNNNNNDHDNKW